MFDLSTIVYGTAIAILGAISFLVYWRNRRSQLNRYFALFTASLLIWVASLLVYTEATNDLFLTLIGRINFAAAILFATFWYKFSLQFQRRRAKLQWLVAWETAALVALTILTPLVDVREISSSADQSTIFGALYPLFIAHFCIVSGLGFWVLYRSHREASATIQGQIAVIGLSFFAAVLVGVTTDIILPYGFNNFSFQDFGLFAGLIAVIGVAYAITTRRLFDIRIIIRPTIVYAILLGLLFSAYSLTVFLLAQVLPYGSFTRSAIIPNFIATLIIGFSFDPLRRWLQERTDAFLYRKEYQQQSVIKKLSNDLNNVIALDEALEIVMQTIVKTLRLEHGVTYVFQPAEHGTSAIKRIKQTGYPSAKNLLLQERDFTIEYFSGHAAILTASHLREELEHEESIIDQKAHHGGRRRQMNEQELSAFIREHARKSAVLKKLQYLEAEIAVPLHLGQQCIGLILLSGKLSGEAYTSSDIQLLELVGADAISSIQKAKLYEGDQMKSEFVSIASHELLTPISAIEGYLSMILDEHIGKIDKQAEDYLSKVYVSARRLSQLVKDLLSVSRIESGKMVINPQAVDMNKMIKDTLDQLHFIAEDKGLELVYQAPATPWPLVKADPDRVMQIMVNLVSNAIKYTPKGSVTVNVAKLKTGELRVDVKDTGLGISKEARSHLFEKFYRVASPDTVGIVGTGLGLYITKSILERMGGSISLESAEGKGSTFSITLPLFTAETSTPLE